MKHLNLIKTAILSLLLQGYTAQCEAQGKYKIQGSVAGYNEGKLYILNGNKSDSVQVTKGKFVIIGEMQDPVESIAIAKNYDRKDISEKSYIQLFIEPVEMSLQINYSDFPSAVLKGSKTQDDLVRYSAITSKINLKYKKELDHFNAIRKKYKEADAAKESDEVLEAIKIEDSNARERLEPMYKENRAANLKFIKDNPHSFYSLYLFRSALRNLTYEQAESYYAGFNPLYKKSKLAGILTAEIQKMKKGVPGAAAGGFNTIDINGKPIKLDDFKGQYILIDFWASWCVPCRKGNPHLLKIYSQYKPKGLEIIGISDDDNDESKWKKAVEKDGVGVWRHALRGLEYKKGTYEKINVEKDINAGYNIHSLPTKILVDPKGIIVARYNGSEEEDKKLDQDLAAIFQAK